MTRWGMAIAMHERCCLTRQLKASTMFVNPGGQTDSLAQTENKIYVAQINTQSDFYHCGAQIQALLSISLT